MARKPLNPAGFEVVSREVLPDGRTKRILRNGSVCHTVPLPAGERLAGMIKNACDVQYGMIERKMREETKNF